ncbi:hypothetical protein Q5P01_005652 [Channa striata]|uniref:Uncharacterized protein n=1 Tax=Channa striata TaxID=64152 RepID=A0AA88T7K1_CHASR|nr:hypothetical protein Q5P01_005652 [Channa striata]
MDSQSRIRYLKVSIGFFEKEIEFDRKKAKIFKEIYLTADRKFEEYLKGLSHGQDTGECSEDFPSENHFLLAEMKKLFAKRNELLAEIGTLVAEGEEESITYLQINIKFLEMLIECEKNKTAEFKKRYFETAEECKEVIYKLNEHLDEFNVEIVFEYEPQPPQGETLLAQRGKQSSCSGTAGEKKKPNATECDPSIRPARHTEECNVAFTRDDEELLTDMEVFRIEMKTNVVLIEEEAKYEVAAVTDEARQEAAKSVKHSDCAVLCFPSCSGHHGDKRHSNPIVSDDRINYLISKLNMLKVQLIYEKTITEKLGQLSLVVGVKFEQLLIDVKQRSFHTKVASRHLTDENNDPLANAEYQMLMMEKQMLGINSKLTEMMMGHAERRPVAVTEVRQEGGERKEAVLQTSSAPENQPLLTLTESPRMDENTPGDTEGSVTSGEGTEQVDIREDEPVENTSQTPAAESAQNEPESSSDYVVKAACVGVAAVAGAGVLAVGMRYFR